MTLMRGKKLAVSKKIVRLKNGLNVTGLAAKTFLGQRSLGTNERVCPVWDENHGFFQSQ